MTVLSEVLMTIDVACLEERWKTVFKEDSLFFLEERIQKAVIASFKAVEEKFPAFQGLWARPCEISFCLSNDVQLQCLNDQYCGKNKPTNVLSFPSETKEILCSFSDSSSCPEDSLALGDVVLSLDTIQREAADQDKSFEDHLTHLVVHGTLHLLGFDHEKDGEATEMETLEVFILAQLDIISPYMEHFKL